MACSDGRRAGATPDVGGKGKYEYECGRTCFSTDI